MRVVKYKVSFGGEVDQKMWNDGWRVSVAFNFYKIKILKYEFGY